MPDMSAAAHPPPPRGVELAALVDTLLPGSGRYPSASAVGVQWTLAQRWPAVQQPLGLDAVLAALADFGGRLSGLDGAQRVDVVRRFEALHPAVFAVLRR